LGHDLRWKLASRLARTDARVSELVSGVGEPQNLVSYHLRVLKRAGLVGQRRSSADARDVYYHLDLNRLRAQLETSAGDLHPALAPRVASHAPHQETAGRRPRVLFICSGNSARSQIAEALLRERAHGAIEVESAGPRPAGVHPLAIEVLTERGLRTRGLRSKGLEEFAGREFDYVISLCDIAREECPPRPERPRYVHWSLLDPSVTTGSAARRLGAFRRTADELETRIGHLIPVLLAAESRAA
jgi:protein-tyrosine-phosphatase